VEVAAAVHWKLCGRKKLTWTPSVYAFFVEKPTSQRGGQPKRRLLSVAKVLSHAKVFVLLVTCVPTS